jgi:hypothetical protein
MEICNDWGNDSYERYFKLNIHDNAIKNNWNAIDYGYFAHLDPPIKQDPGFSVYSDHILKSESSYANIYDYDYFDEFVETKKYNGYNNNNVNPSLKRSAEVSVTKLERDTYIQNESDEEKYSVSSSKNESSPSSGSHVSSDELVIPKNIHTDRKDIYFVITEHPLKHQVKEFNILPAGILQLMRHYQSSPSDYIVVKLLCDPKMEKDQIFLTAVSTHYLQTATGEISIPSLKVSQKMLPGRTKGFVFRLLYELFISGKIVQTEVTDEFFIWSNVNQKGYPRKERDAFISQRIESNKKKGKPKRKTPGRPRKRESDEIDFEES